MNIPSLLKKKNAGKDREGEKDISLTSKKTRSRKKKKFVCANFVIAEESSVRPERKQRLRNKEVKFAAKRKR